MRVAHRRLDGTRGREQIGCLPGIGMFKETQAEERGEIVLNLQHNRNRRGPSGDRATADHPNEHNVLS